jgi:hypothetical protein
MKITRLNATALGAVIGLAAFVAVLRNQGVAPDEFETEGQRFRERTIKQFRAQAATEFAPFVDMTPYCKAEKFEGMPLHQVRAIFMAAGAKELVDVGMLAEFVQKANNADYFGVFDVGSSFFGKVDFSMQIRVHRINGVVAVREITSCGVRSVYL